MKIDTSRKPKDFVPITVTLIIETRDELLNLWARLNSSSSDVEEACKRHGWSADVVPAVQKDSNDLFFALDQFYSLKERA